MFFHINKFSWARRHLSMTEHARDFITKPWSGGVVLLVCVIIAMALANMEWSAHIYHQILTTDISVMIHTLDNSVNLLFPQDMNVEKLVNDGLMVLFFFVVGLEIKREVLHGELSSPRKAILPILAALGGMLVPAFIYMFVNHGMAVEQGWGIPMATDIAFAIGILSMLGDRVPTSLKIFLTALAIADDLGAIIVIAIFYGGSVDLFALFLAFVIMAFIAFMNRMGERSMISYMIPAVVVWTLFYYSGVHATMSGVVMALLIPTKARFNKAYFLRQADELEHRIVTAAYEKGETGEEHFYDHLREMKRLTRGTVPMSAQLEHALAPYITFIVMPIFAIVNGGVAISSEHLDIFNFVSGVGSIGLGIFFGLVVGKPVGIFIMSYLAIKLKLATMPSKATWAMLFAVACLGGIGFTMSIFVDTLAFKSVSMDFVNQGKIAILAGSLAAALLGVALIMLFSKRESVEK
ncbi:MAG: Na+/H+ antiporter NhaA [Rikenellaceae bacterium]